LNVSGANSDKSLERAAEQELIQACLRGDSEAWQSLYRSYRDIVWAVLHRMLGPDSDLEDLVQTVFMKVVRTLNNFEGRSRLSTWLYRICVHVAMDYLRKKSRARPTTDLDNIATPAHPGPDPSEEAERREAMRLLGSALGRMKESKRTVLVLHDLMEVDAQEIARMLGKPIPTVRSRLFYARRELARRLKKAGVKE
jgi:RNA polymerase sigma-70 factor (ECF subfamily)